MFIRIALAAAVGLLALNAEAADLSRIAAAFGNTVLSVYPDGRTQKFWLHPNGDWDGLGRNGRPLAGHWALKGDQVCMRQSSPPTLPFSYCTKFPSDPHVGVVWTSKDFGGNPITLTVVKGMPDVSSAR